MKLRFSYLAFLTMFFLFLIGGNLNNPVGLYAQELSDSAEAPEASGTDYIEPGDDELASLLTAQPNLSAVVRPLIQTKWGQGSPYNDLFPYLPNHAKANNRNGRLVTDCGTTTIVQIMAFHRHPARGSGQSTVLGPHKITVPSVDLNAAYDWNNMLNSYRIDGRDSNERQRSAVAALFYHYGMARGAGGGHAVLLVNNFGYDRSIQRLSRVFYTDAEWEAIIRQQLDAHLPLYYWGTGNNSNHAFVIDGYDSQGRFHINMGWRGKDDGWYSLNNINPGGNRRWFNSQFIIINIKPNQGGTGSDELFIESIASGKTNISVNEAFSVTVNMRSPGFFPGGQAAAALTDNNGRIVEIIGTANYSARNPGATGTREMQCYVPGSVRPGQYRLMIAVRPTGGEWKIMTRSAVGSGVPNFLNITVTAGRAAQGGGYGIAIGDFAASTTSAARNEQFTVSARFRNISSERFPGGNYSAALVNDAGLIMAVIRLVNSSADPRNPGSQTSVINMDCVVSNTVPPGRYQLRMVVRTTGNDWRIVTDSYQGGPTSIPFTVR